MMMILGLHYIAGANKIWDIHGTYTEEFTIIKSLPAGTFASSLGVDRSTCRGSDREKMRPR
jgi:hypothetical protein